MPGRDGTGPLGQGPMMGRGMRMARRRGMGGCFGLAGGRGQGGFRRSAVLETADEKTLLRRRLAVLEQTQSEIKRRLNEIEICEE